MTTEIDPGKPLMVLTIIWFAFLGSLAIYLGLGLLVLKDMPLSGTVDPAIFAMLRPMIYGLSILFILAGGFLRKRLISGRPERLKHSPNPAVSSYMSGVLISLALAETPGIYGLVLFLLGRNPKDLLLLTAFSAAALLYYKPNRNELMALIQKQNDESSENQPQT